MGKADFCICRENKDADQLRGNREADQRLRLRYMDSTIPLLPEYEITSLLPSSVAVKPGLCRTLSETPKTDFLRTRLSSILRQYLFVNCFDQIYSLHRTHHLTSSSGFPVYFVKTCIKRQKQ